MTLRVPRVTCRSAAWTLRRGEAVIPIEVRIQDGIADMSAVDLARALAATLPWRVYGETVILSDALPTGTTEGHPGGAVFVETAREQRAPDYVEGNAMPDQAQVAADRSPAGDDGQRGLGAAHGTAPRRRRGVATLNGQIGGP